MLEFILNSVLIAIIGYVFTHVLMNDGNVLYIYKQLIEKIPLKFIRKPLGMCTVCFTGQLALWSGIFIHNFDICSLIGFICTSIFTVIIIENRI